MSFLNPALLAGGLLFAVPLIIHLLNRQRHKRRPWAAMEFLLRAYKKQRNRLRRENLILLLLRCLLPVLLALAVARPLLDAAGALTLGGGLVHHVLVIDGSYSMGAQPSGLQSPFERARELTGELLDRLEGDPQGRSKVTLVLAAERPRFLVRGSTDLGVARAQWVSLVRPDDAAADLTEAMVQVAEAVEEDPTDEVRVYVLTDLQRRALGHALDDPAGQTTPPEGEPPAGELTDTLRDVVERLAAREGTSVHWIDTGPLAQAGPTDGAAGRALDNVQITGLRVTDPVAVVRSPVSIAVTLRNLGAAGENALVTLEVDGASPTRQTLTLPAGAEGETEFQLAFREPGRHRLRASLQGDALPADDERFLVVEVRERVQILLVDGETSADPVRSFAHLYRLVLDPDPELLPTFALHAVDTVDLISGKVAPRDYDVTVLADVDNLTRKATEGLRQALAAGRGLLVAFGPDTDASSFNLHLYDDGDGPQPFRLLAPLGGAGGSTLPRTPIISDDQHGIFDEFEEPIYREIFQRVPIHRWFGIVADSLTEKATVAARLTDAEQSPLLVTTSFGEGKVAFLTSPPTSEYVADRWNRLDDPLVAFPLLHGIVKWLALPAVDPFHVRVGAELTCSLPARPLSIEVARCERDGGGRVPIADEARPLPGGRFALPPLADTRFAGFYTFDFVLDRESGQEPMTVPFAVNVAAEEGELGYATHAEVRAALGLERVETGLPSAVAHADEPGRGELGPSLLLATLLLVLGEAAMARFVSRRRL